MQRQLPLFSELHASLPLILDLWYSMYVCSHVAAYSQQRSLTEMFTGYMVWSAPATLYELTLSLRKLACNEPSLLI